MRAHEPGFSVLDLLVVLVLIVILAWAAAPICTLGTGSRSWTLRHDLLVMRDLIAQYRLDCDYYPGSLEDLVRECYLREIPIDHMTHSRESWIEVHASDGSLIDVQSGAPGKDKEGVSFRRY